MVVKPIVDQGSKVRPEADVIETTTDHNSISVGLVGNAIDAVLVVRTDLGSRDRNQVEDHGDLMPCIEFAAKAGHQSIRSLSGFLDENPDSLNDQQPGIGPSRTRVSIDQVVMLGLFL